MKYNSIGEQLIAKAQELDPSYKPDKFNDMSEAIDVILNNTNNGDNYIDFVFSYQWFMDHINGYNLTIPANTITEDMLLQMAYGKKKGLLLKIQGPENEEISDLIFLTIALELDMMSGQLATSTTNLMGQVGYWTLPLEDLSQDQVCKFNLIEKKVWYELPNLLLLENITQEQFNEIKNLALQNQLAGVNCGGLYCPLTFYQDGENMAFFYPWYENDIFTAYLIRLDTDLSVKKIPYSIITLPQTAPTSQVIPSITTSNTQQNLTVGDGLKVENGVLKTTYPNIYNAITFETGSTTKGTIPSDYFEKLLGLNGFMCYNPSESGLMSNIFIYKLDGWGIKSGNFVAIYKSENIFHADNYNYVSTITISSGDGAYNLEITEEYPTRVFEPTINSVSISNDDTTKQITFNFSVSNFEILTYLTTLIENNKPFTETLYLKTPTYEGYQMMFNTPLSLVNAFTSVNSIYHSFSIIMNPPGELKSRITYDKNNMILYVIFSSEEDYTSYKQVVSALFTNDTKIKITIKTDE